MNGGVGCVPRRPIGPNPGLPEKPIDRLRSGWLRHLAGRVARRGSAQSPVEDSARVVPPTTRAPHLNTQTRGQ